MVLLQRSWDVAGQTSEDQHDEHEQTEQALLAGHDSVRPLAAGQRALGESP